MSNTAQTVIVTGASSGIGFAIAEAYIKRGANVVGNARSIERLQDASAKWGNPSNFLAVAGDISLPETAEKLFDAAITAYGSVDILINNAGIFIAKTVVDYTTTDLDALINTNLKGFFYPVQQAAKVMAANGGQIVNITASLGLSANRAVSAVIPAMVKGGLNQATKSLALELSDKNIRVNAVAPGIIQTPMHEGGNQAFLNGLSPAGRTGQVQDIVDAVLYLTDSGFTSGAIIPVDGGSSTGTW